MVLYCRDSHTQIQYGYMMNTEYGEGTERTISAERWVAKFREMGSQV